ILLLAALASLRELPAQKLRWDLPENGAHTYQRTTQRFEVRPPPSRLRSVSAIADGHAATPHAWRYFACPNGREPDGFADASFDDSSWPRAPGGFGPAPNKPGSGNHRIAWTSATICARTTCDLGRSRPKALLFEIDHDDGVRVWLNGQLVLADDGYGVGRRYIVRGKALKAWRRGDNTIAVRCSNIGGSQYLDVALRYFPKLPRGMRTDEQLHAALRAEQTAASRMSRKLFGPYRPPAMLLQGELDEEQQHVMHRPVDLRELAWWVATDLRCGALGGRIQLDARRIWEIGDIKIRGRAGAIDPDGWQTITAKLETLAEPARGQDSAAFLRSAVLRFVHHGFAADLKIRRRIEVRETGARVAEFESELVGQIFQGRESKEIAAGLEQRERWLLQATHENRDTDFRLLVKRAIEKGTARLLAQLASPAKTNNLKKDREGSNRSYHSGRLALGLLALIKGGVPKDNEVVQRCLKELRGRTLVDTYTLGNALMALESYYQPASEISMLRSGTIDRPRKREVPEEDRALMKKWVGRLLKNVDTRVDSAYLLRFNYVEGGRFDNSLQQYGLLGLYAAHLCGVDISSTAWEAAANHLLDVQQEDGDKHRLELMDYRTHTRLDFDPDAPVTVAQLSTRANGWSYYEAGDHGADHSIWGSMTCAGITGLAICQAALLDYEGQTRRKLQNSATRARNNGFAWLAKHMTVRYHPGSMIRQRRWLYYYLYGLERAALLSGVALIQGRDWYFEGAMMLVLSQLEDGNWPGELQGDEAIERTAMAVLFLKQSTNPVLTGK
ncbi:MAG: hypothetical protein AB8H80_18380, partial [Planctomycetota bacterium]